MPGEKRRSERQPGCGVEEEEGADHVHAVEVVEPQVEMDRTCGSDEKRRGPLCGDHAIRPLPSRAPPGREVDVLGHQQRIRTAGHGGLP